MIKVTEAEQNATYSIDLLKHNVTGEYYVVKYVADWEFGDCIGGHVEEAAGPLHHTEVAALRSDPFNWDADPSLDIVNDEYNWETIYTGNA